VLPAAGRSVAHRMIVSLPAALAVRQSFGDPSREPRSRRGRIARGWTASRSSLDGLVR
jgi:hypothetical protein